MAFQPNELYFKMAKTYQDRVGPDSKVVIVNEGSSRSSKTWDFFHLLVSICQSNPHKSYDIYILRDTLVNCRDFTMKEFQDCLKTIGIYDKNCMVQSPKPVYKLFGHTVKFRGLDDEQSAEGYPSDILFFNEILEMNKSGVAGLVMRCRRLVVADFNPKYSDHWLFGWEKRDDTVFTHSTYKNNRHLQPAVIKEIESYSPWMLADMALPESDRRPHAENIANGTVDKYRWMVYGMGLRANREGLVFPNVNWIDEFPKDVEHVAYGMDFGIAAPTAVIKAGLRIKPGKSDLYLQKLHYAPAENSDIVNEVLDVLKIPKHIWSDTDMMGKGWIADLRRKGKEIYPTVKFPGSRDYWITTLKRFNIHIVRDADARREQENFCYRVVDGKQLSETIKDYDHFWSACGYGVVGDLRELIED